MTASTFFANKLQNALDLNAQLAESHGDTVLFVGKGPSAVHAKDYTHWGDVVTVNDAGKLLPGVPIRYCCVDGQRMAQRCDEHVGRIGTMVIPAEPRKEVNVKMAGGRFEKVPLLVERWALYPYGVGRKTEAALRDFCQRKEVAYFTPAESGMLLCAAAGYKQIWCFGHDGGHGVAEGLPESSFDYDVRRQRVELAAGWLREFYGVETRFWPEGF